MEAMGATFTSIAQASAARGQGGSNNLQRFEGHHPSALEGGGDPMVAGNYFRLVKKDTGVSDKRKESQPSSNSKKK